MAQVQKHGHGLVTTDTLQCEVVLVTIGEVVSGVLFTVSSFLSRTACLRQWIFIIFTTTAVFSGILHTALPQNFINFLWSKVGLALLDHLLQSFGLIHF
jgi:hypothetical protein